MSLATLFLFFFSLTSVTGYSNISSDQWSGWGGNIYNNRYASSNDVVNSKSISTISPHCKLDYDQGVSATPAISRRSIAYYPTWSGLLVALSYITCEPEWIANITTIIANYKTATPTEEILMSSISRSSPQIDEENGILYTGTRRFGLAIALDVHTGAFLGAKQISGFFAGSITMSPTLYDGKLFIGASSSEETAEQYLPDYTCCSFIGNMVALTFSRNTSTFSVIWNVTTIPELISGVGQWSGAAVWGSQPSIDVERRQVFFGTGNLYRVPKEYERCLNETNRGATNQCLPDNVWQDSIVAIDIDSGHVNWVRRLNAQDAWTVACGTNGTVSNPHNCPQVVGPDADFGMAPTFVPVASGALTPSGRDVVVAGQKNGNAYAVDARTGEVMWASATSPGGLLGGLSWGIAVDKSRVYFNALNNNGGIWQLQPSNRSINGSAYGALSLADGSILWQTEAQGKGSAYGPATVVGDVVVNTVPAASSPDLSLNSTPGGLVLLDPVTGRILQTTVVDSPSHGGIAVQDQYLLFGSGYQGLNGTGHLWVLKVEISI